MKRSHQSSETCVVEAQNLGKAYRLYRGAGARLFEAISGGRYRGHHQHWALRGVDFRLESGMALGLCGANGAGKSTLLKLLAGTTEPSEGRFRVRGRVASLLELGTGFHPDFTGRENVALHGVLAGHSRREVRSAIDEILDFAELGEAADAPVRTYSTGMGMRLGFAAALGFDPELLILDEVFAVGDMYFQKKCVDRLLDYKRSGRTILFCSHSLYDMRQLCDEALWLESGELRASGDSTEVTCQYATWQQEHIAQNADAHVSDRDPSWPSITGALLRRADGTALGESVRTGDDLCLEFRWRNPQEHAIQLGVTFVRQDQTLCAAAGTHFDDICLEGASGEAVLHLPSFALLSGRFSVRLYLFDGEGVFRYEECALDEELVVEGGTREVGLVRLEHRWDLAGSELVSAAPESREEVA